MSKIFKLFSITCIIIFWVQGSAIAQMQVQPAQGQGAPEKVTEVSHYKKQIVIGSRVFHYDKNTQLLRRGDTRARTLNIRKLTPGQYVNYSLVSQSSNPVLKKIWLGEVN